MFKLFKIKRKPEIHLDRMFWDKRSEQQLINADL